MNKFKSIKDVSDSTLSNVTRFESLSSAGRLLAAEFEAYSNLPDPIVLTPVLGGVPVAREVASHLGVPLDFIIIRRLLTPEGPGSALSAVSVAGSIIIDEKVPRIPETPQTPVEHFLAAALSDLELRQQICRGKRAPGSIKGKSAILIDCGIHTGSTMRTAIAALRRSEPKTIVVGVPIASREAYSEIAGLCDDLICLAQPEMFINTGYWYRDFNRPGDDEIERYIST